MEGDRSNYELPLKGEHEDFTPECLLLSLDTGEYLGPLKKSSPVLELPFSLSCIWSMSSGILTVSYKGNDLLKHLDSCLGKRI